MNRYQLRSLRLVVVRALRVEMFELLRDADAARVPSWLTASLRMHLALFGRVADRDAAWLRSRTPLALAA